MKILILVVAIAGLAGCAKYTPRTGSICITPFDTASYLTNDPTQIKQDVADKIRDQLAAAINKEMEDDVELIVKNDCSLTDYVLTGKFSKIDVEIKERHTFTGLSHKRLYDIEIVAQVKNKKGDTIESFEADKDNRELLDVVDNLADKVKGKIGFQKVIQ